MKRVAKVFLLGLGLWAAGSIACAEDRLTLSVNGSTLTGTDGGAGGSIGWLHDFSPNVIAGAAYEVQSIADEAHWHFGSLRGAYTGGEPGRKWSVSGEAHKGSGDDNVHHFTYQIVALGASLPLYENLSLQLEDRQIDIDTAHGNLPKIGLSYVWNPRVQTTVSYADSTGGNLGTYLSSLRFDLFPGTVHLIAGGVIGKADSVVVNLQPGVRVPARTLHEGFLGVSRMFGRTEVLLLGDYLKLGSSERVTGTLNFTVHLGGSAK